MDFSMLLLVKKKICVSNCFLLILYKGGQLQIAQILHMKHNKTKKKPDPRLTLTTPSGPPSPSHGSLQELQSKQIPYFLTSGRSFKGK